MHQPHMAGVQRQLCVRHLTPQIGDSPEPAELFCTAVGCQDLPLEHGCLSRVFLEVERFL